MITPRKLPPDQMGGHVLGQPPQQPQGMPKVGVPPSGAQMMPSPLPAPGGPEDLQNPMAALNPNNAALYLRKRSLLTGGL